MAIKACQSFYFSTLVFISEAFILIYYNNPIEFQALLLRMIFNEHRNFFLTRFLMFNLWQIDSVVFPLRFFLCDGNAYHPFSYIDSLFNFIIHTLKATTELQKLKN